MSMSLSLQEIHEMTEARAVAMGQYGHNNQPCHHILYLFALLGTISLLMVQCATTY